MYTVYDRLYDISQPKMLFIHHIGIHMYVWIWPTLEMRSQAEKV